MGSAWAHHSFSMFDMNKNQTLKGTVLQYNWTNPHAHILIKVVSGPGQEGMAGNWDIEGGSVNIMARQGWNRSTFKVGDPITVVGHPMRDGSKGMSLFYVVLDDGKRLYHDIARPKEGE
ncbi:MAG: DUF6152 family protein [Steroidobacteraceae bacterium]